MARAPHGQAPGAFAQNPQDALTSHHLLSEAPAEVGAGPPLDPRLADLSRELAGEDVPAAQSLDSGSRCVSAAQTQTSQEVIIAGVGRLQPSCYQGLAEVTEAAERGIEAMAGILIDFLESSQMP